MRHAIPALFLSLLSAAVTQTAVAPTAVAQTQPVDQTLLCIPDQQTGFTVRDGKWVSVDFNVEAKRFVVKPIPEQDVFGGKVNYEVRSFGEKYPQHKCFKYPGAEMLICNDGVEGFKVNFNTMRFMEYYLKGYIDGKDVKENTPFIALGKCSPL